MWQLSDKVLFGHNTITVSNLMQLLIRDELYLSCASKNVLSSNKQLHYLNIYFISTQTN